jgi:hypothetical protein
VPSSSYPRIAAEPAPGDEVLSVRPVVTIRAPFKLEIGIVDGARSYVDEVSWPLESTNAERWTIADQVGHTSRPGAGLQPWTPAALGALRLSMTHAGTGELRPAALRLDYVWVPAD